MQGFLSPSGLNRAATSKIDTFNTIIRTLCRGALGDGSGIDAQSVQSTGENWNASEATVYAGMWHSGAIVDGRVYMWGKGTSGRLGLSDEAFSLTPSELSLPGAWNPSKL